jgi:glutamate-5-semialdehyde dehydrogenase
LQKSAAASRELSFAEQQIKSIRYYWLLQMLLYLKHPYILEENEKDLSKMDIGNPKYDRLKLTADRLQGIASDTRNVAALPSPLGRVLKDVVRPNGMHLRKVAVPFGVIGIIYEARPNVSFDVFSLCLKTGNACVLKGGSDADYSNRAIIETIHQVLIKQGVNPHIVELLPAGHDSTAALLHAEGYVDLIIPRGSSNLIQFTRKNATIPVIETGAGVCHTYFDEYGDVEKGKAIINNAKTRRVTVCNALDCVIIHQSRLNDLPELFNPLIASNVIVYADAESYAALDGKYPTSLLKHASSDDFRSRISGL